MTTDMQRSDLTAAIERFIQEEQDAIASIEAEVAACLELDAGAHSERVTKAVHDHMRVIPRHRAAISAYSNVIGILNPQED